MRRLTVLRNSVAVALVFFATAPSAAAGARLERKVVPTFQSVRLAMVATTILSAHAMRGRVKLEIGFGRSTDLTLSLFFPTLS